MFEALSVPTTIKPQTNQSKFMRRSDPKIRPEREMLLTDLLDGFTVATKLQRVAELQAALCMCRTSHLESLAP